MLRRYAKIVGFLVVAAAWMGNSASAQTLYWDPASTGGSAGGGSGTWDTGIWWQSGVGDGPWVSGDAAAFGGTAGTATATVTLLGPQTASDLFFNAPNYFISGGTANNSLTLSGGSQSINMNASSGTITAVIGGSSGMVYNGPGNLWLNTASTVIGGVSVNSGTLTINGGGGGPGAFFDSALTVAPGATLDLNVSDSLGYNAGIPSLTVYGTLVKTNAQSETLSRNITLSGGTMTSTTAGAGAPNGAWNLFGPAGGTSYIATAPGTANYITGVGDFSLRTATCYFSLGASSTLTVSVPVTQNGNSTTATPLNLTGSGLLTLSGPNTYTGNTNISGGTLVYSGTGNTLAGSMSCGTGTAGGNSGTLVFAGPAAANFTAAADGDFTINWGSALLIQPAASVTLASDLKLGSLASGSAGNVLQTGGSLTVNGAIAASANRALVIGEYPNESSTYTLSGGSLNVPLGTTFVPWNGTSGILNITGGSANLNTIEFGQGTDAGSGSLNLSSSSGPALLIVGSGGMAIGGANYTATVNLSGGTLGGSANWTSALAMTLSNAVTVTPLGNSITLSGLLSGGGTLTDSGAGALVLVAAANQYSGGTIISGGSLNLGAGANENSAGLGTGPVTINSGGTLHLMPGNTTTVFDIANSFTLNGATVIGEGGNQHLGTGGATINIGASGAAVEATLSGQDVYIDGLLSGSGGLALVHGPTAGSAAIVHITNGGNTYNGTVSVSGAGNGVTLDLDSNTALQFATVNVNPGTGSTMVLTQTGVSTIAGLTGTAGTLEPAAVAGAYTLDVNSAANSTYGGALVNGSSGTLALLLTGSGRLALSNSGNTYGGGTTVFAGQLNINSTSAIGSGLLTISNTGAGVALDNSSGSAITLSTNNAQLWGSDFTFIGSNNLNLGSGSVTLVSARTVTVDGGNLTVGGPIGGVGAGLTLAGSGQLTLTGSNTYDSGMTIKGGTLNINNDDNLGSSGGRLTFSGGSSTLQQASSASVSLVSGRSISISSGTAVIDTQGNAMSIAGAISGSGALVKVNPGALTLGGLDAYTGATKVNAGGLYINGSLPSSIVSVAAGAVLGGSGTIGLATTIASGGTIDVSQNAGNSALTLASTLAFSSLAGINFGALNNYTPGSSLAALSAGTIDLATRSGVRLEFPGTLDVSNGTYDLISYKSIPTAITATTGIALGSNQPPLGARQTPTLITSTPGVVLLVISGDFPIWTGANGTGGVGAWVGQSNYVLYYSGSATDFETNDTIQFNDQAATASSGTIAVKSTTVSISGSNVFPNSVTFNNNVLSYTITGTSGIAGSGVLVMNGIGNVTIATSNSFGGGTQLNAGQLNIDNASALGTGPLTIAGSGVRLDNTSGTAIGLSTINNQFWNSNFTFVGSNNLNLGSGSVTLGSSRIVTVDGGNLTVGGPIGGGGGAGASLTLAGSGQLTLGGANTYSNGTFVSAGTLTASGNTALSSGPVTLDPSSGTAVLAFTSPSPAISSLASSGAGSSLVVLGNVAGSSSTSLTIGAGNASSTFSGTITDGSAANPAAIGGLTKAGNGILVLPGITSYSGPTSISGGTLEIGNGTSGEQFASPTVSTSGTLAFNHADTLTYGGSVSGSGALEKLGTGLLILSGGSNAYSGGTTISGGTLQIGDGLTTNGSIPANGNVLNNATLAFAYPAASTFSGVISSSGGVEKSGSGMLTLNALQTYTGGTTVNGGTLALNNNNGSGGTGVGSILGVLTINPGTEVNILVNNVFGYSGSATGLTTLNINGGVLNQSYGGNETVTGVTVNMTAGTISATAVGGYFDMFANGYGNTNVNVLPSTAASVISAALRLRETPNPIFTVSSGSTAAGVDLLVSGQINQAAAGDGFTKAGPGVMQLSNSNNTYTGVALISAGTLQSASNGALGPGTAGLTVNAGGVLDLYGSSPTVGGLNGAGTVDNSQGGAPAFTVGGGGAGGSFSGTIRNTSGTVSFAKIGAGTQYLSGTNTYTGGTTLSGGTLNFTPGAIPLAANSINFNGGTLQWAAGNTQDVSPNIAPIPNGIAAGIDPNGNNVTFGSSLSGSGGLALFGSGTLSLAVANSFSGSTTINGGTLNVAHPLALHNSTVAPGSSGAVSFATGITTPTFGGLSGGGNINLATATSQPVTLNVGSNGQNTYYSGVLSGGGGLVKTGGGVTTLANAQSYAGATIVSAGTLQLYAPDVGIKFATNRNGGTYNVTGTAGAVPQGNWNNLPGQTQATPQSLQDGSGNASSLNVTWSGAADNYDVFNASQPDQNAQLLNSYLDDSATTTPVVNVSGVPYASYNVYVYFGSDGNARTGSVSISGSTYYYNTDANIVFTPYPLELTTDATGATYPLSNYAEFSGLSGSSFTVTQTRGSSNSGIAAVEIVNAASTLPAASPLVIASSATLDLGGANQQVASLSDAAPGLGGTVTNSGLELATLALGTTGSATFSGSITDGNSPTGLAMNGTGIQVLAGTNTYSGGTTVASGILLAENTSALAQYLTTGNAVSVSVSGGATFAVQAGTLSGEFGVNDLDIVRTTANFASGANFGISVVAPESFTYNSTIGDSGNGPLGIVKLGSGMLTLGGSNTYSNGTTVSGGTLQMGANNSTALGTTGSLTVNRGVLDLNGNSLTVTALNGGTAGTITSSLVGSASLAITAGGAFPGTIEDEPALAAGSAPLSLIVSGGTLVLSGTHNSYSGGTYVDTGMLVDAASGAIPDGSSLTVSASATLAFDSTQAGAGPVVGSNAVSAREISAVPEPGTIMLLVAALGSAVVYRRFRGRNACGLKSQI